MTTTSIRRARCLQLLATTVMVAIAGAALAAVVTRGATAQEATTEVQVEQLTYSAFGRGTPAMIEAISADGRYVVFNASDTAFTDEDEPTRKHQIFLLDRDTGEVELISRAQDGSPSESSDRGFNSELGADVSDDGRYVVYNSVADDIVPVDPEFDEFSSASQGWHTFLHDRQSGETRMVSRSHDGYAVGGSDPSISGDGSQILFRTSSDRLSEQDANGLPDLYLYNTTEDAFTLVSAGADGTAQGQLLSSDTPQISGDGSTVVYTSTSQDVLDPPTTQSSNIFAFDVATGTTRLVSATTDGSEHDGAVSRPRVSDDGAHVAFLENGPLIDDVRQAGNLDDTGDPTRDLVVKDLDTGSVTVATIPPGPEDAPLEFPGGSGAAHVGISGDGTRVAFAATGAGSWDTIRANIFIHDLAEGVTFPLHDDPSPSTHTYRPQITADGLEVVFDTEDTQLADGPDTGDAQTLMASRMTTEVPPAAVTTERLVFGLFDPSDGRVTDVAVTPDGRYVAFISDATDLLATQLPKGPRPYLLDRDTGGLELLTVDADGQPVPDVSTAGPRIDITPDARYVAFTYSTDLDPDPSTVTAGQMVFVRDRQTGTTQQVSRDPSGEHMRGEDPSISDDGRYVAFTTPHQAHPDDTNGVRDAVVYDRREQVSLLVSRASDDGAVGDAQTIEAHISGDGSTVVFESLAKNLVDTVGDGFFNVYAHDLTTRRTTLVSALPDGTPSNGDNQEPRVTSDGDHVVFLGGGRGDDPHNLDPDDDLDDVFVKERSTDALEIASIAPEADVAPEDVRWPSIATDGSHVGFRAEGPGSWNAPVDPAGYIRNLDTGTTIHMTPPDPDGTSYEPQHLAVTDDGRSLFFADVQLFVATRVDTTAPTWPTGATLRASDVGQTVVTLTWDVAEDDTGIAAYRLLQDGAQVAEVDGTSLSTTVTGLTPETTYAFTVVAVDEADNATPGPSTTETTAADDGAATLLAEAHTGGIVSLTWDPATAADGYRILRDAGEGFETVTDVGADVLSYEDTGQPAETTLTYRIDVLDGTDTLAHTHPVSVVTPSLTLGEVAWDGPRNRAQRLLLGEAVTVQVVGEPNRDVAAVVTIESWDDGDGVRLAAPAPRDIEVALSETDAGIYTGELPLTEGIAQVVAVAATMTDGAGSAVTVTAEQPATDVTGAIEVTLDISGGDVTAGRITAIPSAGYGAQVAVEGGPGPYRIDALTAANDHELRLVGPDGSDLVLPAPPVDVHAGLTTAVDLIVSLPSSLTVDVGSSDEVPSGTVLVLDPGTGDVLDSGGVRGTGIAGPFRGLTSGSSVGVRFVPNGNSLHDEVDLTDEPLQLDPGDNLLEAAVPVPPLGRIDGTVVEEASGLPVADAAVTHLYPYLGRTLLSTATTDADGRFSFQAPTGVGTIRVVAGAAPRVTVEASVTAGDVTPLKIATAPTRPIEVRLDLFTQLPDGDLVQAPMYSQQAAHFHVTTSVGSRVVAGGSYPFRRVVSLADTSVLVCADGWEAGLNAACDEAVIGTDDVAHARIELVWPGAAVGTLHASDGQPIGASTAWSAVVRQATTDGHRVIDRHAGQGPDVTLPLRELGTYSIDVITDEGDRTVLEVTATSATPTAELGVVPLDPPGPFAEFIGETEKNLSQRGSDVGVVNLVPGPDGWLDLRIDLDNAGPAVSDATLRIEHPSGARPDVEVATVDGTAVTSAVSARTIDVPLGSIDADGRHTIRARLAVPDGFDDRLVGVRAFLLTAGDRGFIGRDELPVTPLTMDVPPVVRARSFEVGGSTRPGGSITVFDGDDQPLARAVAAADGRWQAAVTLPDRGPWFHHRLYAELDDPERPAVTGQTVVEIDETLPELTSLTMAQSDGRVTEIELGDEPFRFPFTFNPGQELRFELTFADPSQVRDPVVVVGRSAAPALRRSDGVFVASMSQWASGLGPIWVTNGHAIGAAIFERPPPTHAEIESWNPHLADVEIEDITYRPEDAITETAMSQPQALAEGLTTALLTMTEPPAPMQVQQTATGASFSGTHQAGGGGIIDVDIDVATVDDYTITAADATREQYDGLPVYSPSVSGSVTNTSVRARAVFSVPLDAVSDVDGSVDPVALQPIIQSALSGDILLRDDGRAMVGPAPTVTLAAAGNVVRVAEVSLDVFLSAEDIRGAMGSPDVAESIAEQHARAYACEGEAGPELQRSADWLRTRFISGEAFKLGAGVAVTGLAGTGIGAVPAAGLGVIAYAMGSFVDDETAGLIDDLELAIDTAYANGECEDDGDGEDDDGEDDGDGDGTSATSVGDWQPSTPEGHYGKCILAAETLEQLGSCGPAPSPLADPTWIHDPSGYVFEAVPSNRLPGVTATVLEAPTAEGPWTVWDADWFGQDNPQTTDADGRYGWDVPEGWWKVRYEADGYLVGESDALEVLPPHFDVNVGLVDPTPPDVAAVRLTSDGTAIDVVFDRYMLSADLDATSMSLSDEQGANIPGEWSFPDAETDLEGRSLAITARFTPDPGPFVPDTFVTVDIGALVRSYAGTPMLADVVREIQILPNTPPEANPTAYTATEDLLLDVPAPGVLHNDADGDGHALRAAVVDGPSDGQLELAPDGSFVYEPRPDFAGTDSFTYVASDGAVDSAETTVTIEVASVDDAPRAAGDDFETPAETPLVVAAPGVFNNDADDGGQPLAGYLTVPPTRGQVAFAGDGSFVYTPDPDAVGTDGFAYRAWDGQRLSDAAWVTIEVLATTDDPEDPGPGGGRSAPPDWVTCPDPPAPPFRDVPADGAHARGVGCLAALDLVRGFEDGTFRPGEPITRAQFASVLAATLANSGIELPEPTDRFTDVGGVHASAIGRLTAAEIISGVSATRFDPGRPITRAQTTSLLVRAAEVFGVALPPAGPPFVDTATSVHGDAIARARAAGIVHGHLDGTFRPAESVQRDQTASLLLDWLGWNAATS